MTAADLKGGEPSPRMSRYVAAGAWNTVFGYGVFALLFACFSARIHYLLIAAFSNVLAISNAYITHKIFVFQTKGNYLREYLKYYVIYGTTALGGLALLAVLASGLGLNVYVAQACVLCVQTVVSFTGHRRFSFASGSVTAQLHGSVRAIGRKSDLSRRAVK
jgi:putative flippase GtrA